jgi:uracil-DNA glycosylase
MFTGDQSGAWLFTALHAAGFANQPTSVHRDDGLRLEDAWVTAALRCAPPANKPTPDELACCQPYLLRELRALTRVRVVVALGRIGWDTYLRARRALDWPPPSERPVFGHGALARFPDGMVLIGCYHPSQQNTFTGKLTRPMLQGVFMSARRLVEEDGGLRAPPMPPTLRSPAERGCSASAVTDGSRMPSGRSRRRSRGGAR